MTSNKITSPFTTLLVAFLVLASTTEARRSAPSAAPAIRSYEQDVAGLGLYGRGYPHAWGVSRTTKNHGPVHNVVQKKKVQRRRGKGEDM